MEATKHLSKPPMSRSRIIGAVMASLLLLSACAIMPGVVPTATPTRDPNVCMPEDVTKYKTLTREIVSQFEDAFQLASNTPRITLSPVIQNMQAIRREAQALELPVCTHNAQNRLIDYMDVSINAFSAFMGQRPEDEVNGLFNAAQLRRSQYYETADALDDVPATPKPS